MLLCQSMLNNNKFIHCNKVKNTSDKNLWPFKKSAEATFATIPILKNKQVQYLLDYKNEEVKPREFIESLTKNKTTNITTDQAKTATNFKPTFFYNEKPTDDAANKLGYIGFGFLANKGIESFYIIAKEVKDYYGKQAAAAAPAAAAPAAAAEALLDTDTWEWSVDEDTANAEKIKLIKLIKQIICLNTKFVINTAMPIKFDYMKKITDHSDRLSLIKLGEDVAYGLMDEGIFEGLREANDFTSLSNTNIYEYLSFALYQAKQSSGQTLTDFKNAKFNSLKFTKIEKLLASWKLNIEQAPEFWDTNHLIPPQHPQPKENFYTTVRDLVNSIRIGNMSLTQYNDMHSSTHAPDNYENSVLPIQKLFLGSVKEDSKTDYLEHLNNRPILVGGSRNNHKGGSGGAAAASDGAGAAASSDGATAANFYYNLDDDDKITIINNLYKDFESKPYGTKHETFNTTDISNALKSNINIIEELREVIAIINAHNSYENKIDYLINDTLTDAELTILEAQCRQSDTLTEQYKL